ncbi:MAG: hypothetical protein AT717_07050 [Vulcanisaeta sp. CIS_19]|nr:MAG: hypothetical protein AT717_07050 [Vulcanisaeta sp. CIS_19]
MTDVVYLSMGRYGTMDIAVNMVVFLLLALVSAVSYILIQNSWPLYQLAIFMVTVLVIYIMRPIPRSVLDQLPRPLRPVLEPFTS